MKNIEPIMVTRYPTVSLCLDSSAFSCEYSIKALNHDLGTEMTVYVLLWFMNIFS